MCTIPVDRVTLAHFRVLPIHYSLFLSIHLEASSESENEATDDFPTVFPSFVRNLPVELGVLRMDPRVPVGKNTRKEAFRKSQCDDKVIVFRETSIL